MNTIITSRVGGSSQSSPKYFAKPAASEPAAAKVAERYSTVTRNVRPVFLKALLTYSEAPAAWGYLVASSAYANPVKAATVTPTANAAQKAPPTSPATAPMST